MGETDQANRCEDGIVSTWSELPLKMTVNGRFRVSQATGSNSYWS